MSAALTASITHLQAVAAQLAKIDAQRPEAGVYSIDAALHQRGAPTYNVRRSPIAEVLASWLACIAGERLSDVTIPSLFGLSVDYRDGALTRGGGGLAYTPHAWSQLVSLFKVKGSPIPDGISSVDRWHSPLTRHCGFEDIKRASKRPQTEEAILRIFQTTEGGRAYSTVRAVVSGRHGLTDTDDSNVIRVLDGLEEKPTEGRVTRAWDKTFGSLLLDSGDSDVRLGFAFSNSETGCGSITFNGSILIKALDVEVNMPDGRNYEHAIEIASAANATRRRHTLPRFDAQSGRRLSAGARTAIAQTRIGSDVEKAMGGARVLAQRWGIAKADVMSGAVAVAGLFASDDFAVSVIRDFLCDSGQGHIFEALCPDPKELGQLRELAEIIANDARLRSIPHGSAAHFAAALALLAVSKVRTWEDTRALQAVSGALVMEGWKR